MLKITSKQADKVHRLVKEQCANCDENGNCILLDDGEAHRCVQLNQMVDFLADMIEKYGDKIPESNKNAANLPA